MRILRHRRGFQADHSSSSYLFYAVDHPVSAKGQQLAHRYSSRAEVDESTARYQKWGESELNSEAYKVLLGEHYDVMASESYDWWTLMIAVPHSSGMEALLAPYREARGYDDLGVEVENFGRHLCISIHCMFDYGGPLFEYKEDPIENLVELLGKIRREIMDGDVSFLQAVASFYEAELDGEEEEAPQKPIALSASRDPRTKSELQRLCSERGIAFRKSWTKEQLLSALASVQGEGVVSQAPARSAPKKSPPQLSKSARRIVGSLERP